METVGQPPADAEIHLLTDWGDPSGRSRRRAAAIGAIAFHVAVLGALAVLPAGFLEPPPLKDTRIVTPLVEPPLTELTQKAPNNGKVDKEFDVAAEIARRSIQIPPGGLTDQPHPFQPPPEPPAPAPKPVPLPEPPRIDLTAVKPDLPKIAEAQPRIQPVEQPPRLALESPPALPSIEPGQGRPLPRPNFDEAVQNALGRAPGSGSRGSNLPASPGLQPNNMQLLSDPMGVDFKPYLTQVLAMVKSYWLAIWPEQARMGRRGSVAIMFSIDTHGTVPKLAIASPSGVDSLDLAAVAAVSRSVPFPPFPKEYKGDLIKLQLNFDYNMNR
jgi:TonB family protein